MEDGTATMSTYNIIPRKASLKNRIKAFVLQKIYKLKFTVIKIYGSEILPVLPDFIFSGVIVNFGNSIMRNIPLSKLTPFEERIEIVYENGAVFLNQAQYLWYTSEDEYISHIKELLPVSKNFKHFFFKFHPYDAASVKLAITGIINENY